jgi:acetoacetyl-CoA reductase
MNRLALITGGTRGIGSAIALKLKQNNYKIIITHYGNDHDQQAHKFSLENNFTMYEWDISNFEDCAKYIKEIEEKYGAIDILINNAGITADSFLHKMEKSKWDKVININLSGIFNMCHAVIPKMRDRSFGRIVNISSINGLMGVMGQTNYSASKAGIIGFSRSLAMESAMKNITVNCVAPGYIETEMTLQIPEDIRKKIVDSIPMKRFGKPEEIADAVVFLIRDESSFITGETFSINGGAHMQ